MGFNSGFKGLKQANFSSVMKRIWFPAWTMQLTCNTPR